MEFRLHSEYQPTGDQPQVIEKLVQGFKEGNQCQTLLGVTGSGKTFTMANVIQALERNSGAEQADFGTCAHERDTLCVFHSLSRAHSVSSYKYGFPHFAFA